MSQASIDGISDHRVWTLTREELEFLADRLYSRGVSNLSTIGPQDRRDLINASRAIVRLLGAYEGGTGRQLAALMLGGQC